MFNDTQENLILEIWKNYRSGSGRIINASKEYSVAEFTTERNRVLPEISAKIASYLSGDLKLEQFKTDNDGINKRNRLWGFKGMNGQMFFNMLYNSSSGATLLDKFDATLKQCLKLPESIEEAKSKISLLVSFSQKLGDHAADKRQSPRTGSCNFFLSFFWQIQSPEEYPVYYTSMVDVLADKSLWTPGIDLPTNYEEFYKINHEIKALIKSKLKKSVTLWDIEHAFWMEKEKGDGPTPQVAGKISTNHLPSSFIPPVVSILPQLAKNEPSIAAACAKAGISTEKAFEERLGMLFRIAGFGLEAQRGQGYGRVPDGIAICREYHYAIIYDAKVREAGYSLSTDDRAIREYIAREMDILRRDGIRNVYFAVVSGSFNGDFDDAIRSIKINTEIREILFIEVNALLVLLEELLRNPELDLGPKGVQAILAQSGTITESDMKEFLGL